MVLSTETFNQSVHNEYSEAVNARYTFQPLWVSDIDKTCYNIFLYQFINNFIIIKKGMENVIYNKFNF